MSTVLYPFAFSPKEFPDILCDWFAAHKRPLPWRGTYTPYAVWISEIMLQQTQMERGVAYFQRWMERFADIAAVAAAPENALLKAWEGLGYYSRVRNIALAARHIMTAHGGVFPHNIEAIRALPGVGPYTAAAIASIAFNQDVALVDANVSRVFSRLFDIDAPVRTARARRRIETLAADLLPQGRARIFNQALMEFGALLCRKRPLCGQCPLTGMCEAHRLGIVAERPVAATRVELLSVNAATGVLPHPENGELFFLQRRRFDDAWPGLWEFPGGKLESGESPEQGALREFLEETGIHTEIAAPITVIRHAYTRYRVTLHCFALRYTGGPLDNPVLTEASEFAWVPRAKLDTYAFPAGHRKLVDILLAEQR